MPFNPFSNDAEETSFEQGSPVTQAAKNVTKAAVSAASSQAKATTQAIVNQLYGIPSPAEPGTDESNPQTINHANPAQMAGAKSGSAANATQTQPLEEQAKLEKLRQELFGNYSAKFKSAQNNVGNLVTDVEQEMEKARQERKRREEERKQQEEEEARQREEAKRAQQQEQSAAPAGKKTGVMFGKKQQQPVALRQAKTKTEINRGTTG